MDFEWKGHMAGNGSVASCLSTSWEHRGAGPCDSAQTQRKADTHKFVD